MSDIHTPQVEVMAIRPGRKLATSRAEMLRAMLPHTLECLKTRRANLIGDDLIADYVALDWLEWAGGGLRLTETGRNLCNMVNRRTT
jgi:archaellum component FlaD/FlaE